MKKLLLPVASGFEEIELIGIADLLRRAGVEVVLASLHHSLDVCGTHRIVIKTDCLFSDLKSQNFDAIVMHGGMGGVKNMLQSPKLLSMVEEFENAKKLIGAICAAPIVLDSLHLLQDDFCCYPGCENMMKNTKAQRLNQAFSQQGHILTATGPAYVFLFAIQITRYLLGEAIAKSIRKEILL